MPSVANPDESDPLTIVSKETPYAIWNILQEYRKPKPARRFGEDDFNNAAEVSIETFVRRGWIRECTLAELASAKYTMAALRGLLHRHGVSLPSSAAKTQLLSKALSVAGDELRSSCGTGHKYQLSPDGAEWAAQFATEKLAARKQAMGRALESLSQARLKDALQEREAFTLHYEYSIYNELTDVDSLKWILAPSPLKLRGVEEGDLSALRVYAALHEIWASEEEASRPPEALSSKVTDVQAVIERIKLDALLREALAKFDPAETVEVCFTTYEEACPECSARDGEKFVASALPAFPLPECTHPVGCIPWVDATSLFDEEEGPADEEPSSPNDEAALEIAVEDETSAGAAITGENSTGGGREYLARCRSHIKESIRQEHPEFDAMEPKLRKTIVNRIIARDFGWVEHSDCEILLRMDEPPPIDFSLFSGLKLTQEKIKRYLHFRAGIYLDQAVWLPQGFPENDFCEELAHRGLLLRGAAIPLQFILAYYKTDELREAIVQKTNVKPSTKRTKSELIDLLKGIPAPLSAPAFLKRITAKRGEFPLDRFFFGNPTPPGLTAEQTEAMGWAARYHERFAMVTHSGPELGFFRKRGATASEDERRSCCVFCATQHVDSDRPPFHPGCTCGFDQD